MPEDGHGSFFWDIIAQIWYYRCGIGDFTKAGSITPKNQQGPHDRITVDLVDQYRQLRPVVKERHIWPYIQAFHMHKHVPSSWDWRPPNT